VNEQTNYNSIDNIKKLSVAERVLIVEDIWDSILSAKEEIPITDEQKKELDSRLEAFYKTPGEVKSWNEVKNTIQSKL